MTLPAAHTLHILFTRLQNIGDALNAVPALRTLRQALPHARISLLGKHAGGLEIMRNCPYIDEIIEVRGRGLREKLRLIRAFRKWKFDYFIISPQDLGRVPWAWLGGARKIAGYPRIRNYGRVVREKLPFLLAIAPTHDATRTEVDNCLWLVEDVLDDLGVALPAGFSRELDYSWLTPGDDAAAATALAGAGIRGTEPFVVAAPFSKRTAKNWPVDRFAALFTLMRDTWRTPLVLLGGENEREQTEDLARRLGARCCSLAGQTPLAASAAIIKRAGLFIGPDSGPAFIATAVGTPAVVMYGPADYYRWRVAHHTAPRIEIVHPVSCSPCQHQTCPMQDPCMQRITVDEMWAASQPLWRTQGRAA